MPNLSKQKELKGTRILELLGEIALVGESFRIERNERAHQGKQREFGDDSHDTLIFKVAAMHEEEGKRIEIEGFDLIKEYNDQALPLQEKYVADVETLRSKILELQEELVDPFYFNFDLKRVSKSNG